MAHGRSRYGYLTASKADTVVLLNLQDGRREEPQEVWFAAGARPGTAECPDERHVAGEGVQGPEQHVRQHHECELAVGQASPPPGRWHIVQH